MYSNQTFLNKAELPQVFLSEEERETLKEVILCGPQLLADIMKELLMFKEKHVDKLDIGGLHWLFIVTERIG